MTITCLQQVKPNMYSPSWAGMEGGMSIVSCNLITCATGWRARDEPAKTSFTISITVDMDVIVELNVRGRLGAYA